MLTFDFCWVAEALNCLAATAMVGACVKRLEFTTFSSLIRHYMPLPAADVYSNSILKSEINFTQKKLQ